MIGKKNFNKGIEVEMIEQQVTVNISIIVDYGFKVQEIAKQVQESVKLAIESMTGLEVVAVNVSVEGINTKMNA
jgi:uncharacterized alkaline shock family protein YloU